MINDHSLKNFKPLADGLLRPIYRDYSFANLPATLHFLLTGETIGELLPKDCFGGGYPTPDRIVLLFIDSFGWQFWQRYAERSTLMQRVIREGTLTPISALFPSTTSAAVTTLNLGNLPAQHGVYEWNIYLPKVGETIQSLPYSTLGKNAVSCSDLGHDIRAMIAEQPTFHQRLAQHSVRSVQLSHRNYAFSDYNRIVSAGAEIKTHSTLPEALTHLREFIENTSDKALINLYWAGLDHAAHIFGPGSPVHEAEVTSFWLTVDALLADLRSKNTLLLITADHGQVGVDAAKTIYVNEICPVLNDCLAKSPTGQVILPNGSPRDMFLHITDNRRAEVFKLLTERLDGIAVVLTVDDAVREGLFGQCSIEPEIRTRLGDILVLPFSDHFVWWREGGILENEFHGHHGGLAQDELITVAGVLDSF